MAQICVDNAQIRDGMGVQSVTLGLGTWACAPAWLKVQLQGAPRPEADSSTEEEEEAARLGEQGL